MGLNFLYLFDTNKTDLLSHYYFNKQLGTNQLSATAMVLAIVGFRSPTAVISST